MRRPFSRCLARATTSGITGGPPVGVVLTPTLPAEQSRKTRPMERPVQVPVADVDDGETRVPNEWDVVFPSQLGRLRDRSNTNNDVREALAPLGLS